MFFFRLLLFGAGQLGSRYLQGLVASETKKKSEFEGWSEHFETYISEIVFSDEYEFFYDLNSEEKNKTLSIDISFNKDGIEKDFMSVIVDLDNFKIRVPDAISSPKDTIEFEEDRTAFSFIENEINQRRTLFGIPHSSDSNELNDIDE